MALTPDDQSFLKAVHQRLADEPLQPGDPPYEPLFEVLGDTDPVLLMRRHIEFNASESIQLISASAGPVRPPNCCA